MRTLKLCTVCGALLAVSLIASSPASAEVRYHSMTFTPFAELTRTHDSNLYLSSTRERSASVSLLRVGTGFHFPVRDHSISLDYMGESTLYSERPDDNNTIQHAIGADVDLKFPSGIVSRIRDTYRSAAEPAPAELTDPVKRTQNDFRCSLGKKWSRRFMTRLLYGNLKLDYLKDSYDLALSRRESDFGMETEFWFSPKTSVFAAYNYGLIDYRHAVGNDSHSQFGGGGIRGKLTERTAIEGRAGVKVRTYRTNSANDATMPVVSLTAISELSDRTRLELNAYRNTMESSFAGNPYYIVNYVGAGIKHTFLRDLVAGVKGQYVDEQYPNEVLFGSLLKKRGDTRYYAVLSCSLPVMEWLTLEETYQYAVRESNLDQYDYTDHYVSMGVRARF